MGAISPELALVDPDLAAEARAALHEPGMFRPRFPVRAVWATPTSRVPALGAPVAKAPVFRAPVPAPHASAPPASAPARFAEPQVRRRRRLSSPVVGIAVACSLAVAGAGAWIFSGGDRVPARAMSLGSEDAFRARAQQQTRTARAYSWPKVPTASGYAVELRRGGRVVYSATLRTPAVALPPGLRLAPGRYSWSVTPIREAGSRSAPRPVLEETFIVR